ncbi:MAG: rRNA maturation RNase YbeY [Nitrospirota bacterium]|nr:rRNA maturation RNase YbeY [Nitrospirota bacterium]
MPVIIRNRLRRVSFRLPPLNRLIQRLLDTMGEGNSELGIELIGDGKMRRLNREFRNIDRTTDVLAFALREVEGPPSNLLGDVVVSIPMAIRQARVLAHTLDEEIIRLLIHGMLHLVGYDHERGERDAQRMQRQEQGLWKTLQPLPRIAVRNE